ncbi:MAG: nucleotidyl transferase AbiEii/AbiGii toxin family protein [Salinisphaera sp.]|nr:nucleotidyl transferase AbiEii/AbiGii toxin family protein [Salinisphaera sp.]
MLGLSEKTATVFAAIKPLPEAGGFLFVGGTALALRLGHRLSENLDFMVADRLDESAIHDLMKRVELMALDGPSAQLACRQLA